MSAPAQIADLDEDGMDSVADGLGIAYLRLARAAAANQHLGTADLGYLARHSQDVAKGVHEAISDIEDVARIGNFAARHQSWNQAAGAAALAAADVHVTAFAVSAIDTANMLMGHLGAALEVLLNVSLQTTNAKIKHALRSVCAILESLATSDVLDLSEVWTAAS